MMIFPLVLRIFLVKKQCYFLFLINHIMYGITYVRGSRDTRPDIPRFCRIQHVVCDKSDRVS